jgi:hypothetical protein
MDNILRILFKNVVWGCALRFGFKERDYGNLKRLKFKDKFWG